MKIIGLLLLAAAAAVTTGFITPSVPRQRYSSLNPGTPVIRGEFQRKLISLNEFGRQTGEDGKAFDNSVENLKKRRNKSYKKQKKTRSKAEKINFQTVRRFCSDFVQRFLKRNRTKPPPKPQPPPLPEGWKELKTESGISYFHNTDRGKTQWDRPTDKIKQQQEEAFEIFFTEKAENHFFKNDFEKLVYSKLKTQDSEGNAVRMIESYKPGKYIHAINKLSSKLVQDYKKNRKGSPPKQNQEGPKTLELKQYSNTNPNTAIQTDFYVQIPKKPKEVDDPPPEEDDVQTNSKEGMNVGELLTEGPEGLIQKSINLDKEDVHLCDVQLKPGDWLFMEVTADPILILNKLFQIERFAQVLLQEKKEQEKKEEEEEEEEEEKMDPIEPKALVVCVNGLDEVSVDTIFDYVKDCHENGCFEKWEIFTKGIPLFLVWTPSQNTFEKVQENNRDIKENGKNIKENGKNIKQLQKDVGKIQGDVKENGKNIKQLQGDVRKILEILGKK